MRKVVAQADVFGHVERLALPHLELRDVHRRAVRLPANGCSGCNSSMRRINADSASGIGLGWQYNNRNWRLIVCVRQTPP